MWRVSLMVSTFALLVVFLGGPARSVIAAEQVLVPPTPQPMPTAVSNNQVIFCEGQDHVQFKNYLCTGHAVKVVKNDSEGANITFDDFACLRTGSITTESMTRGAYGFTCANSIPLVGETSLIHGKLPPRPLWQFYYCPLASCLGQIVGNYSDETDYVITQTAITVVN